MCEVISSADTVFNRLSIQSYQSTLDIASLINFILCKHGYVKAMSTSNWIKMSPSVWLPSLAHLQIPSLGPQVKLVFGVSDIYAIKWTRNKIIISPRHPISIFYHTVNLKRLTTYLLLSNSNIYRPVMMRCQWITFNGRVFRNRSVDILSPAYNEEPPWLLHDVYLSCVVHSARYTLDGDPL